VAKTKYLRAATIPGKFYVSEGWKGGIAGKEGVLSQHQHYNQLDKVILAGPYETRNEAENWNTTHANGHADIWQF
jgi:hypothetical protein